MTGWLSGTVRSLWRVTFAEAEGLSITQIASLLGRSPATVKAYFYDPAAQKAWEVKALYVGA